MWNKRLSVHSSLIGWSKFSRFLRHWLKPPPRLHIHTCFCWSLLADGLLAASNSILFIKCAMYVQWSIWERTEYWSGKLSGNVVTNFPQQWSLKTQSFCGTVKCKTLRNRLGWWKFVHRRGCGRVPCEISYIIRLILNRKVPSNWWYRGLKCVWKVCSKENLAFRTNERSAEEKSPPLLWCWDTC